MDFLGYVSLKRVVGKDEKLESLKSERAKQSWKEPSEVGKLLLKLESSAEVGKL